MRHAFRIYGYRRGNLNIYLASRMASGGQPLNKSVFFSSPVKSGISSATPEGQKAGIDWATFERRALNHSGRDSPGHIRLRYSLVRSYTELYFQFDRILAHMLHALHRELVIIFSAQT